VFESFAVNQPNIRAQLREPFGQRRKGEAK
jgi:hypothetical protein